MKPEAKVVHWEHPSGDGRKVRVGACKQDPQNHGHPHYEATQWQPDELPAFVDLRSHLTPVEDQGEVGSCTANALAGALEYLEKRTNGAEGRVSRLFIYWNERDVEGTAAQDHGAALSDGIKVLKTDGACSEDTWQYDKTMVFEQPAEAAYDEAKGHTIDEAHKVKVELHDMRHCLAEGYPFVFGLQVYDAFQQDGEKNNGVIRTPDPATHEHAGGHAMLCVGYSDKDQVFLVRNSWGPGWGVRGYCYIPYGYLANSDFCHDAWTIRVAHNLDFTQGAGGGELPHGNKDSFLDDNDDHTVALADDTDDTDSTDTDPTGADDTNDDSDDTDSGDDDNSDDANTDSDDTNADSDDTDSNDSNDDSDDSNSSSDDGKSEEELQAEIQKLDAELAELKSELGGRKPAPKKHR